MGLNREVRKKHHFHACPSCGYIWDHNPDDIRGQGQEVFDKSHTCDKCGSARNCDIACASRDEAEEFAVHEYISVSGERYYTPNLEDDFLRQLLGLS